MDAATRFSTLVASGDQIPFDVAENAGSDSIFHSYRPLTAQFVRERTGEVRSLPAFEAAREAVEAAGVAAPYLEQHGEAVPAEPGERAERMLIVFIAALWDGCSEFSLDRARLDGALAILDAEVRDAQDADVLIAPIAGLRMPLPRLRLAQRVELVRADTIEAPLEAMRSEGMGRAAWEPQLLAVADQDEGAGSAATALRQLRELISVMRIFKAGGVGLGPYAFAPTGEGRLCRIATGAPPGRPGGYELSNDEAAELVELAAALEARPDPDASLSWAVRRFEMGCKRESALDGLSDNLLALRAVLDGRGPVGASLPMRAAALVSSQSLDRDAVRERVERALELERSLMAGASREGGSELADWVEQSVRGILRSAALGELGTDLGAAADEALIATGLAAGDAQISVSVQAEINPGIPGRAAEGMGDKRDPGMPGRAASPSARASSSDSSRGHDGDAFMLEEAAVAHVHASEFEPTQEEYMEEDDTRILEPIPAEDEIKITATNWLDEVSSSGHTLEWPAGGEGPGRRERIDSERVRHLFPVPEDADWEVRELDYDHYSRRAG